VIGGLASATTTNDVAAFAHAAAACGVHGLSLYNFDATKPSAWPLLDRAAAVTSPPGRC
jgi:hypothetical protein